MSDPQPSGPALPHQPASQETLADLGEWELIRRLGAFAPIGQFSDDAALLRKGPEGQGPLVINTDVLVEGLHFSDATTEPADVGWRAAAVNLSDLAAMGCTEVVGLTVGLVAPASTPWHWVEGVYAGISQCLQTHGGVLLGGDCSGGAQRVLAVTALGGLPSGGGAIRRRDGRPGDLLVCTGSHGLSRLGLALLQGELAGPGPGDGARCTQSDLPPGLIQRAIIAHRRPVPRFDAVQALIHCRPTGLTWRVGGCDSSDGLTAAVGAIAQASGCSARLSQAELPLDPAMAALPQARAWCLRGGEDFELVLALQPDWAEALVAAVPGSGVIGALVAGPAGELGWTDGTPWSDAKAGFEHFRRHDQPLKSARPLTE